MNKKSGVSLLGNRIEGIVFDLDGTLTDSIEHYFSVFQEAMARVGVAVTREQVLGPMALGHQIWDVAVPAGIPNREEKIEECRRLMPEMFKSVFKKVQPFPGITSALERLVENGLHLGVVTSSWGASVLPLYDHAIAPHFRTIITRDDGFRLKPAPDGILECLRRLDVDPGRAITVGDTPLDIRAGRASGTWTIAVLSGSGTRKQLEAENPTFIVETTTDILSVLDWE